ncbi:MAG TPA: hypothetical protein VMT52_03590, partial [Planctomycetota bacterium]|nr:hypothetical protein [Planctomycetota bacterium]
PENLILVVAGGFDPAKVLDRIKERLEPIAPRGPVTSDSRKSHPLGEGPKRFAVAWDARARGVCIAFPPPESARERLVLTLWGGLKANALSRDAAILRTSSSSFVTQPPWNVGTLPFFVHAAPRDGVAVADLEKALADWVAARRTEKPIAADVRRLQTLAAEAARDPPATWLLLEPQAILLAARLGVERKKAAGMVLGNIAIQLGTRELLLGADPQLSARELDGLSPEGLSEIIVRSLDPSRSIVTTVEPAVGTK